MSLFTPTDTSLAAVLPYRSFLPDGALDLRSGGVTVALEFLGPSPEVSDLADLASRSRQLAGALVHLGTGDMLQVIFNREPAPEPPKRVFTHRAAAMVDAERRAQFAAENHWLSPARLYLTHAFEPPVRSWVRSMLFATNGPRRHQRHQNCYCLGRGITPANTRHQPGFPPLQQDRGRAVFRGRMPLVRRPLGLVFHDQRDVPGPAAAECRYPSCYHRFPHIECDSFKYHSVTLNLGPEAAQHISEYRGLIK